jgi:hypothetical protein
VFPLTCVCAPSASKSAPMSEVLSPFSASPLMLAPACLSTVGGVKRGCLSWDVSGLRVWYGVIRCSYRAPPLRSTSEIRVDQMKSIPATTPSQVDHVSCAS